MSHTLCWAQPVFIRSYDRACTLPGRALLDLLIVILLAAQIRSEWEPTFPAASGINSLCAGHFSTVCLHKAVRVEVWGGVQLGYQGNPVHSRHLLEGDWIRPTLLKGSAERFNALTAFSSVHSAEHNTCVCMCQGGLVVDPIDWEWWKCDWWAVAESPLAARCHWYFEITCVIQRSWYFWYINSMNHCVWNKAESPLCLIVFKKYNMQIKSNKTGRIWKVCLLPLIPCLMCNRFNWSLLKFIWVTLIDLSCSSSGGFKPFCGHTWLWIHLCSIQTFRNPLIFFRFITGFIFQIFIALIFMLAFLE